MRGPADGLWNGFEVEVLMQRKSVQPHAGVADELLDRACLQRPVIAGRADAERAAITLSFMVLGWSPLSRRSRSEGRRSSDAADRDRAAKNPGTGRSGSRRAMPSWCARRHNGHSRNGVSERKELAIVVPG
jgi:hypothetical protein